MTRPAAVLAALCLAGLDGPAAAQPEPTFTAACGELRQKSAALEGREDELITIDVVGELTAVEFDGTVAYMAMCAAPDPLVLCVTYSTGDYEVGDRVVLTGSYYRDDEDRVRLDPCLHYPPDSVEPG